MRMNVTYHAITNNGHIVKRTSDFDAAVSVMDDDIRERVHTRMAPCTEQEFMDAYCAEHEDKYGKLFVVP